MVCAAATSPSLCRRRARCMAAVSHLPPLLIVLLCVFDSRRSAARGAASKSKDHKNKNSRKPLGSLDVNAEEAPKTAASEW